MCRSVSSMRVCRSVSSMRVYHVYRDIEYASVSRLSSMRVCRSVSRPSSMRVCRSVSRPSSMRVYHDSRDISVCQSTCSFKIFVCTRALHTTDMPCIHAHHTLQTCLVYTRVTHYRHTFYRRAPHTTDMPCIDTRYTLQTCLV